LDLRGLLLRRGEEGKREGIGKGRVEKGEGRRKLSPKGFCLAS